MNLEYKMKSLENTRGGNATVETKTERTKKQAKHTSAKRYEKTRFLTDQI